MDERASEWLVGWVVLYWLVSWYERPGSLLLAFRTGGIYLWFGVDGGIRATFLGCLIEERRNSYEGHGRAWTSSD